MSYTVQPLSDRTWLRTHDQRIPTRFRSAWMETEEALAREVEHLGGSRLVIEVDLRPQDLRLNGTIRANAREATTPAVIVTFTTTAHGDLAYRCDTFKADYSFQGPHWQHNVRAVVKTLEALRAVDRYGATKGEQYTGFKALPAGRAMPASHMTNEAAVRVIATALFTSPDQIDTDVDSLRRAVRRARANAHPDHHAGSRQLWDEVEEAANHLRNARLI